MEYKLPDHITGEQDFHGSYYLAILKELQRLNENIEKLIPKEEKKDGMESVGRTRRERGTKPSTGTKTSK